MYEDNNATMPQEGADDTSEKSSAKDSGAATAVLPKDFFGDKTLEAGKRCEVEIQKIMDDQVLVSKVPDSEYKDKESGEPPDTAPESSSEDMMD